MGSLWTRLRRNVCGQTKVHTEESILLSPVDQPNNKNDKRNDDQSTTNTSGEDDQTSPSTSSRLRGNLVGCVFAMAVALADIISSCSIQTLDQSVPHAELNIGRFSIQAVIAMTLLMSTGCNLRVERASIKWVAIMAVVSNFANMLFYGSMYYGSVGTLEAMKIASQVMQCWVLGSLIFKKFQISAAVAAALCLVGTFLAARPEFLFPGSRKGTLNLTRGNDLITCFSFCADLDNVTQSVIDQSSYYDNNHVPPTNESNLEFANEIRSENRSCMHNTSFKLDGFSSEHKYALGIGMSLASGVLFSLQHEVCNRKLSDINSSLLLFWVALPALSMSTLQMLTFETPSLPDCWLCLLMLALHCVTAALGGFFVIISVQHIPALFTSVILGSIGISGTQLLQNTLMLQFGNTGSMWVQYLGAGFCIAGVLIGPLYNLCIQHGREQDQR